MRVGLVHHQHDRSGDDGERPQHLGILGPQPAVPRLDQPADGVGLGKRVLGRVRQGTAKPVPGPVQPRRVREDDLGAFVVVDAANRVAGRLGLRGSLRIRLVNCSPLIPAIFCPDSAEFR